MGLLALCVFFPTYTSAQSQSLCHPMRQRMYRITTTEDVQVADSLQMVLDLATAFRNCEQEVPVDIEVWLLNNEVFALDGLERFEEADSLVSRFFDTYFDENEISDLYRAKFYMWRFKLHGIAGAMVDMVIDYAKALQYAEALGKTLRASLRVDGAAAYFEGMEFGSSVTLARRAQDLIGTPSTRDERNVVARALLFEGEALLMLERELPQAREQLGRAIALYSGLDNTSKVAIATAILGHVYAAEGDTSRALSVLATATELADQSGIVRSQIYTGWRYGRVLRQAGDFEAAEPVLERAFEAAQVHPEFYFEATYELACLRERQGAYDQAKHLYQAVIDAPQPRRYASALKAQLRVEVAEMRLTLLTSEKRLAESKKRHRRTLYANIGSIILLLVLGGAGSLFLRQRYKPSKPPLVVEKAAGGVHIIPTNLPTGLSLGKLKQRFQHKMEAERAGRCWAYAYAALLDPDLVLPFLKEGAQADAPWLADLIAHVEADSLPNNRVLHRCVIAVETAVDGEAFGKNPENTMLRLFQRESDKRGWTYPTHPTEWKRHFIEHHLDILFERSGTSRPTAFWPGLHRLRALKEKAMFLMIG